MKYTSAQWTFLANLGYVVIDVCPLERSDSKSRGEDVMVEARCEISKEHETISVFLKFFFR